MEKTISLTRENDLSYCSMEDTLSLLSAKHSLTFYSLTEKKEEGNVLVGEDVEEEDYHSLFLLEEQKR